MNYELKFGSPKPYHFDTILDQFSGTKYNSFRTSTIPLLQFWKDHSARVADILGKLNFGAEIIDICFEFPTPVQKGYGKGKSSMTDIMLICDDIKVAIEAKFTEYKKNDESIEKWNMKNSENKKMVLKCWTDLIQKFSNGILYSELHKVSYQFIHRAASACCGSKRAFVIYQLFYDENTEPYLDKYIDNLKKFIKIINPTNDLQFFVWEVDVKQLIEGKKKKDCKHDDDNPYSILKCKDIYKIKHQKLYKLFDYEN